MVFFKKKNRNKKFPTISPFTTEQGHEGMNDDECAVRAYGGCRLFLQDTCRKNNHFLRKMEKVKKNHHSPRKAPFRVDPPSEFRAASFY